MTTELSKLYTVDARTSVHIKKKLRALCDELGGVMSESGCFFDTPHSADTVGWGIVSRKDNWIIVAVPR